MSASKEKLKRLLEEKQRRVCSVSLATFIKEAWHVIEPETELLWNYHLDCICDDLEYISRALIGETPPELPIRDVYNVPPRYMKSIAISIMWPVWEWGPFGVPWSRWLFGSYDMGLATDHSVARRTIIESEWYQRRWGHLFTLSTDQNVKTQFANNRRGVMRATSVGGGKIGRGGHRVVLDDPHDPEKILSDDTRERDVRVFRQGFTTRLDDKRRGAIVIVMQRLHEQDISATAESLGYRVVAFDNPCQEDTTITTRAGRVIERKAGEILWPAREDREQVESMRRVLGPFGFAGQYLQRPSPAGGVIFQREWWKFYRVRPAKFDAVAISIDCAFKGTEDSDFVGTVVAGFNGAQTFILEIQKERLTFTGTKSLVETLRARHPGASRIYVEDKANGPAIIDDLKNKIAGLVPVEPQGGKIARAWSASGDVEAGNVLLPEYLDDTGTVLVGREWVAEFIDVTAKFPKVANDDDVDAFTQLIIARRGAFAAILDFMRAEAERVVAEQRDAGELPRARDVGEREQHVEHAERPTGTHVEPTQPTISVNDAMKVFGV
jgi:predicted phage terminase large subunit-like protein